MFSRLIFSVPKCVPAAVSIFIVASWHCDSRLLRDDSCALFLRYLLSSGPAYISKECSSLLDKGAVRDFSFLALRKIALSALVAIRERLRGLEDVLLLADFSIMLAYLSFMA
jgi:hypothetical protein